MVALVLAALFTAVATFQPHEPEDRKQDQVESYWIVAVIFVVVTGVVYGGVLPRVRNAPRAALVFGILAIVSLVVFWLGLAPVLGVAAFLLGWEGRNASSGRGLSVAGLVLGLVAIVAGGVFAFIG